MEMSAPNEAGIYAGKVKGIVIAYKSVMAVFTYPNFKRRNG